MLLVIGRDAPICKVRSNDRNPVEVPVVIAIISEEEQVLVLTRAGWSAVRPMAGKKRRQRFAVTELLLHPRHYCAPERARQRFGLIGGYPIAFQRE